VLLTSPILLNRETFLQASLPVALSAATLSVALVQVQSGGWQFSLVSGMPPGVVPGPVKSASAPPSSGRGNYPPTQSQASYHSASSSPLARRPFSGFDGVNEEADVRANAAVVDGHADVCASAVMTHVNDNDADDSIFDDALCKILGASSRVVSSLDLDLAFDAVNVNVDIACIPLLSPLSSLLPSLASRPPSAAAGEPI